MLRITGNCFSCKFQHTFRKCSFRGLEGSKGLIRFDAINIISPVVTLEESLVMRVLRETNLKTISLCNAKYFLPKEGVSETGAGIKRAKQAIIKALYSRNKLSPQTKNEDENEQS